MLILTVDLDWAPEPAIEETLDFLQNEGLIPTVFATHRSPRVESSFNEIEVGLHPFFHPDSSHGNTFEEVVKTVMEIPHNVPAFRCHRYATCNESSRLMVEAGMQIASNICTNLEQIPPFFDRLGLIQVPIYFEDGGYLWQGHSLTQIPKPQKDTLTVVNIHPMHFVLNTPTFEYMVKVKRQFTRESWRGMNQKTLASLKHQGKGIRSLIISLIEGFDEVTPLVASMAKSPQFSTKIGESNVFEARQ